MDPIIRKHTEEIKQNTDTMITLVDEMTEITRQLNVNKQISAHVASTRNTQRTNRRGGTNTRQGYNPPTINPIDIDWPNESGNEQSPDTTINHEVNTIFVYTQNPLLNEDKDDRKDNKLKVIECPEVDRMIENCKVTALIDTESKITYISESISSRGTKKSQLGSYRLRKAKNVSKAKKSQQTAVSRKKVIWRPPRGRKASFICLRQKSQFAPSLDEKSQLPTFRARKKFNSVSENSFIRTRIDK